MLGSESPGSGCQLDGNDPCEVLAELRSTGAFSLQKVLGGVGCPLKISLFCLKKCLFLIENISFPLWKHKNVCRFLMIS